METETLFEIKQEAFSGPIEVLLDLIEKRKLFVNDISLATVTDDFINYINNKGMHPDMVANFLSVAATLILIKARSLLPNIELTEEESQSIDELERRLALYKIISEISIQLSKEFKIKKSFGPIERKSLPVFAPSAKMKIEDLLYYLDGALKAVPQPVSVKPQATVFKTISISEVIQTLTLRLEKAIKTSFSSVLVNSPDGDFKAQKVYTIVSFLGMLELVRCGFIEADQPELFADIMLEKQRKDEVCEVNQESYE